MLIEFRSVAREDCKQTTLHTSNYSGTAVQFKAGASGKLEKPITLLV